MPMSSPMQKTVGSDSISSQSPCRIASRYVAWAIKNLSPQMPADQRRFFYYSGSAFICVNLRQNSLEMYRRLRLLQLALTPPRLLRHAVLGFDLVATFLAVNALRGGVRLGHGRVLGKGAIRVDLSIHFGDQLFLLLRREPLLAQ